MWVCFCFWFFYTHCFFFLRSKNIGFCLYYYMTYVSDSGLSCGNDGCVFSEVASLSWKLFSLVVSHSFSPWKLFIFFNHFLSYSHTFFCIGAIPVSCSRSHAALSISKDAGFQFLMILEHDTSMFLFLLFSMLILIQSYFFIFFLYSLLIFSFLFFSFMELPI